MEQLIEVLRRHALDCLILKAQSLQKLTLRQRQLTTKSDEHFTSAAREKVALLWYNHGYVVREDVSEAFISTWQDRPSSRDNDLAKKGEERKHDHLRDHAAAWRKNCGTNYIKKIYRYIG